MCWLDNYQNSPNALVSCSFGEHHDAKQPAESSWRKRRYECFCSLKRYTFTSVSYGYLLLLFGCLERRYVEENN